MIENIVKKESVTVKTIQSENSQIQFYVISHPHT